MPPPPSTRFFRRLNLAVLNEYAITASVFPSGHTACAFSAAFGLWHTLPERRAYARALLVLATLIALATIYGRYHYAVDTAAGLALALLAAAYPLTWRKAR
jgi:membrane-associated phospholipid phosphatase